MKAIWKYKIPVTDQFEIEMPYGAQILSLQVQNGQPNIWALVDTSADRTTELRKFRLFGTGHQFDMELYNFIGTFQIESAVVQLVFHLFEKLGGSK